jgi:NAD-dependent SIR2 family protein deacetylase
MFDPMTSLAFSVYSNKGGYALLLGSGVSRASGIPTGWGIVTDFIRRAAALEGNNCGPDPTSWYRETYKRDPDYSELLQALAKSSSERMHLLKSFFEPTDEEKAAHKKLPTPAHHAIAKLVAEGYVRVIITTNFDRLMERALEA